jgi:hypothetical protein
MVREQNLMPLMLAISKMTYMPAKFMEDNGIPQIWWIAFHRHSLRRGQRHDHRQGLEGPEGCLSGQAHQIAGDELKTD